MLRKWVTRRTLTLTALGTLVSSAVWPKKAHASLFGEENASLLAILAEMIEQVLNAVKTVEGVFETVDQLVSVVSHGATMLEHLTSVEGIKGLLNWITDALSTLQTIDRDVTKLGYKFDAIDQQHRDLFPTRESLSAMPAEDFKTTAAGWNRALRESSLVAMRANTSIETLQTRADTQKQILEASKGANGVVAQLQAVVSALSLLHSDMSALETNLAAGQRVTAVWAGQQSASQDLAEEMHKRMMDDYTREDTPGDVLTELP